MGIFRRPAVRFLAIMLGIGLVNALAVIFVPALLFQILDDMAFANSLQVFSYLLIAADILVFFGVGFGLARRMDRRSLVRAGVVLAVYCLGVTIAWYLIYNHLVTTEEMNVYSRAYSVFQDVFVFLEAPLAAFDCWRMLLLLVLGRMPLSTRAGMMMSAALSFARCLLPFSFLLFRRRES